MKRILLFLFVSLLVFSCKKETSAYLLPEYQDVAGIWNTQSISWDSLGIRVTHSSPYNILVIHDDLSYSISMDIINRIENGTVNIITQNSSKLEIFFAAQYPSYSSFAGSHIFGMSNVILVSLAPDEMVFRSVDPGNYPELEFRFLR